MIDPKVVELSVYNDIPHLLYPVVTDPKRASLALRNMVKEMHRRYELFAQHEVRDIAAYNELAAESLEGEKLPYIVVIIDELADLMLVAPGEVEDSIARLAQMSRAAGIHLVIATQRPSVDVLTGIIKANITSRIAFTVSSQVDSRTILDMAGAEKLLGRGDMLFYPVGAVKPFRVQGAYVSEREVKRITDYIRKQGRPSIRTWPLWRAKKSSATRWTNCSPRPWNWWYAPGRPPSPCCSAVSASATPGRRASSTTWSGEEWWAPSRGANPGK